jgi:hypothetical protein
MDGRHLQQVVESWEQRLLSMAPQWIRMQLSTEATTVTENHITGCSESLGELTIFAHAEIGMRVLLELAIRSASESYTPDMRLPEWNDAIAAARSQATATVDAWQTFSVAR